MPKSSSTRGQKMVGIDTSILRPTVKPPSDLSAPAKKIWRKLIATTPNEQFTDSDFPLLATYCEVYATMRKSLDMMHKEGEVMEDRWGKSFKNPWFSISQESASKIPVLAMKLRLSPSSRKKNFSTNEKPPVGKATSTLSKLIKR